MWPFARGGSRPLRARGKDHACLHCRNRSVDMLGGVLGPARDAIGSGEVPSCARRPRRDVLPPRRRNMPSGGRDRRQPRRMHRRHTHATRPGPMGRPLSDREPHWVLSDTRPSRIRLRLHHLTRSADRSRADLRFEDRRDMGDVTAVNTLQTRIHRRVRARVRRSRPVAGDEPR